MESKRILVVDDEPIVCECVKLALNLDQMGFFKRTFAVGGTMALLAKNKNRVYVVIYTNDNKGSYDQDMTSERLARIRKAEEEASCAVLGIPRRECR